MLAGLFIAALTIFAIHPPHICVVQTIGEENRAFLSYVDVGDSPMSTCAAP
jgi:hypothetical protein